MREIHASSPQAMLKKERKTFEPKYPWRVLTVGQSFSVQFDEMKEKTLINYAYRMGKKLKKRFRVLKHDNCYEVACIEDVVNEQQQVTEGKKSKFF
jgi:hypothetical protein